MADFNFEGSSIRYCEDDRDYYQHHLDCFKALEQKNKEEKEKWEKNGRKGKYPQYFLEKIVYTPNDRVSYDLGFDPKNSEYQISLLSESLSKDVIVRPAMTNLLQRGNPKANTVLSTPPNELKRSPAGRQAGLSLESNSLQRVSPTTSTLTPPELETPPSGSQTGLPLESGSLQHVSPTTSIVTPPELKRSPAGSQTGLPLESNSLQRVSPTTSIVSTSHTALDSPKISANTRLSSTSDSWQRVSPPTFNHDPTDTDLNIAHALESKPTSTESTVFDVIDSTASRLSPRTPSTSMNTSMTLKASDKPSDEEARSFWDTARSFASPKRSGKTLFSPDGPIQVPEGVTIYPTAEAALNTGILGFTDNGNEKAFIVYTDGNEDYWLGHIKEGNKDNIQMPLGEQDGIIAAIVHSHRGSDPSEKDQVSANNIVAYNLNRYGVERGDVVWFDMDSKKLFSIQGESAGSPSVTVGLESPTYEDRRKKPYIPLTEEEEKRKQEQREHYDRIARFSGEAAFAMDVQRMEEEEVTEMLEGLQWGMAFVSGVGLVRKGGEVVVKGGIQAVKKYIKDRLKKEALRRTAEETVKKAREETAKKTTEEIVKRNRISEKRKDHIFRKDEGHIEYSPANQNLIEEVANNPANLLGPDKHGTMWYAQLLRDGRQIWAQVRNNEIINAGINRVPRNYNPETGLSALKPKGG